MKAVVPLYKKIAPYCLQAQVTVSTAFVEPEPNLSPLDSRRIDNPISLAFMVSDCIARLDIDCMLILSSPYVHINE